MRKKGKQNRSRFAQNRIEYIVYGNPKEATELVHNYGYESPKDVHELVQAIKELVRRKGRKVIKDLIKIHPDKKAIVKLSRQREDNFCGACSSYSYNSEDNFCGACGHSNYTGDTDLGDFINQLVDMNTSELENYYQDIMSKSNADPDDMNLADEVQIVWNELRKRKVDSKDEEEKKKEESSLIPSAFVSQQGIVVLGLTLLAGVLVGASIKGSSK